MKRLMQKELDTMLASERTKLEDFIDDMNFRYRALEQYQQTVALEQEVIKFFYTDEVILYLPVENVRKQLETAYGHLLFFDIDKVLHKFTSLQQKITVSNTSKHVPS